MAEIIRLRSSPHEEVQQLLPWLINGTLRADELARVEAHVAECPECRGQVDSERLLGQAVAGLPLNCDGGWERMKDRLDRQMSSFVGPAPKPLWRRRVPVGWALASPFAAAAAVALVFVNVSPRQQPQAEYHALGSAPVVQPANLVVEFGPATRVSEMQDAVQSVDARLVDGPTETGAYLLRVDQAKRELALKRLRDNQAITLAEPIDAARE